MYGEQAYCAAVFRDTDAFTHSMHQFITKNWAKAEFVLGVATLMAEAIGVNEFLHVQRMLGEILHAVLTLRAFMRAAEADAAPGGGGVWAPHAETLWTARSYFPQVYPRLVEILQLIGVERAWRTSRPRRSVEAPSWPKTSSATTRARRSAGRSGSGCSAWPGTSPVARSAAGRCSTSASSPATSTATPANHYNNHDKQPYRAGRGVPGREPSPLP